MLVNSEQALLVGQKMTFSWLSLLLPALIPRRRQEYQVFLHCTTKRALENYPLPSSAAEALEMDTGMGGHKIQGLTRIIAMALVVVGGNRRRDDADFPNIF